MWKKSVRALLLTLAATAAIGYAGVHDVRYLAICASAAFALFVNLEIGWKVLKGRWDFSVIRTAPTSRDYLRRVLTAFGIVAAVGILSLLVGTAGDYNLFQPAIAQFWPYFALAFAILLAIFVVVGYPKMIFDTKFLGAYVAHAGLAIFVLGVIASAGYTKRDIIRLPINKPVKAFDNKYTLTFRGVQEAANEHTYWVVNIADKHGYAGTAKPLTFWTDFNNHTEPIRNPGIVKYASRDLYFTLNSAEYEGGIPKDTLGKQQEANVLGGKLKIKFINFDFPQSEKTKMFAQQPFHVKAYVYVTADGKQAGDSLTLGVTRNPTTDEATEEDVVVPGTTYHVQLSQLMPDMQNPANSKVVLRYFDDDHLPPPPTEVITVEAFMKPYINLVWGGIITLVIGFGFSVVRRRNEARVAIDKVERAYEKLLASQHGQRSPDAQPKASIKTPPFLKKKQRA